LISDEEYDRLREPNMQAAVNSAATKTCPDYAESVLAGARVCRYCGYRFEPANANADRWTLWSTRLQAVEGAADS
jgi:hypothetical protein